MYIFHSFPNRAAADQFVRLCASELDVGATSYAEQRDDVDPFPFELTPPVVYVELRCDGSTALEQALKHTAEKLGGRYAGT